MNKARKNKPPACFSGSTSSLPAQWSKPQKAPSVRTQVFSGGEGLDDIRRHCSEERCKVVIYLSRASTASDAAGFSLPTHDVTWPWLPAFPQESVSKDTNLRSVFCPGVLSTTVVRSGFNWSVVRTGAFSQPWERALKSFFMQSLFNLKLHKKEKN